MQVLEGLTQEQVGDTVKATLLGRGWAINRQRARDQFDALYP